jgi:Domain of unknown function (DUF4082)
MNKIRLALALTVALAAGLLPFALSANAATSNSSPSSSSIFGTAAPSVADSGDPNAVELGIRFEASESGYITGVRFYKASTNTGTHVGSLWTSSGTLLAQGKFTNESASGWQNLNFTSPVAVTAGTIYVAGYYAPKGHYSATAGGLSTAITNGPLTAVGNSNGGNGVYAYSGTSVFPSHSYKADNYWVDVDFTAGSSPSPTTTGATSTTATTATTPTTAGSTTTTGSTTSTADTIFGNGTPATVDSGDGNAVELGVSFQASVAGQVTGVRFYKSAANTGTHLGSLWTSSGTLLASGTFSNESASGWQNLTFSQPVSIAAGTTYVAGYYAPNGHYSDAQSGLSTSVKNGPLTALSQTTTPDGLYAYGSSSSFPTSSWKSTNYYVDVDFVPSSSSTNTTTTSTTTSTQTTPTQTTTTPTQTTTTPTLTTTTPVQTTTTQSGGGSGAGGSSTSAPVDVVAPYFSAASGEAVVGQTLSVNAGSWSNSPSSYSYKWEDCTTSSGQPPVTSQCSAIAGATQSSYTVVSSNVGHSLEAVVTATNSVGSASTGLSGRCADGEDNAENESNTAPPPAEAAGCSPISAVAGTTASTEKFCSNAFATCGYPDPLTSDVGVPAGTTLTTVSSNCGCIPSGASWNGGTLEITGNNVTLKDLNIPGNIQIQGTGDTITDSQISTGICGSTCSNEEPIEALSTAKNTEITYDTVFGGSNGTVHNASNEPLLIDHVYSYGSCTGQLGYGDVWNSYFVTDIPISDQSGGGLCHVEAGYVPGGFSTWAANPWGGTCPGNCAASTQSYTNYSNDVMLNPQSQTAAIFLDNHAYSQTGNNNVQITGSFVAGGGYTVYGDTNGDTSSNILITNNRWSSMYYPNGGSYGSCVWNQSATTMTGDIWDDNLNPITTSCGSD